jgi:hypothetical protein
MSNEERLKSIFKVASNLIESLKNLENEAKKKGIGLDISDYYQLLGYIQGLCADRREEEE